MKLLKLWENPMLSIEDRLEAAQGEVERLHNLLEKASCSVKKANEQAEHFEREWYLRGDEIEGIQGRYNELLFAVGNKYPDETRHETTLRYIRQAETVQLEADARNEPE